MATRSTTVVGVTSACRLPRALETFGAPGVGVHQLPPHKRRQDPSTTGAVDPG